MGKNISKIVRSFRMRNAKVQVQGWDSWLRTGRGHSRSFTESGLRSQKEEDTHDDFKPVSHTTTTPDVTTYINKCITDHKVIRTGVSSCITSPPSSEEEEDIGAHSSSE